MKLEQLIIIIGLMKLEMVYGDGEMVNLNTIQVG